MTETEMYEFVETFTNPDQIQSYLNDINSNDGYEYIAIKLSSNLFSIYRKPKKGNTMKIKFKKLHPEAVEPKKATSGAAGFDMTAVSVECVNYARFTRFYRYHTGIALELPPGWCALAFPRSSIVKKNAFLGNSVGVIDSDYRGEVTFCFKGQAPYVPGDRIGQLVIIPAPDIVLEEAVELSETARGAGGYGSTGA